MLASHVVAVVSLPRFVFGLAGLVVAVMLYYMPHAIALRLVAFVVGVAVAVLVLGAGLLPLAKLACEYCGLVHLVMP